nr:retrovirus-related Pol polyprotein from transposon TNT 1-94 [Tanacetum cinerariifolium]
MTTKIHALENNKTWIFTLLPSGKTPIGSKWVYKIKLRSDGTIDRYKPRLVAKGFNQKEGIDYTKTFAPVAKMPTVRTLIVVAVQNGWPIQQLDVNNAFLHGDLNEEVYMTVPQGYPHPLPPNVVCKLTKSIYGLNKQTYNGIEFLRNSTGLAMSQRKYALDLLKYADTLDIKPVATPMDPIVKLNEKDGDPLTKPTHYRTIVLSTYGGDKGATNTAMSADGQPSINSVRRHSQHMIQLNLKRCLQECKTIDKIRQGHIKPLFVTSQSQAVDILTYGLSKYLHYNCFSKLNICDPYTVSTYGGDKGATNTAMSADGQPSINSILDTELVMKLCLDVLKKATTIRVLTVGILATGAKIVIVDVPGMMIFENVVNEGGGGVDCFGNEIDIALEFVGECMVVGSDEDVSAVVGVFG